MNITDILNEYRVPFKRHGETHHATTNYAQIDCPMCGAKGKWRMGIHLTKNYATCWNCGPHQLLQVLTEITGAGYAKCQDLVHSLKKNARFIEQELGVHKQPRGSLVFPKGVDKLLPAHRKYLRNRGFNVRELERLWGVKGIGMEVNLSWRVFIPIYHHGEVVSWTTRSISDDCERKYISASPEQESVSHKEILFGMDYVRHAAMVTEGPLDAMSIGPGAVATLGTTVTKTQVEQLARIPLRYICLDNEPQAQARAEGLCNRLGVFPGETRRVVLDSGKDPGECSMQELTELRKLLE